MGAIAAGLALFFIDLEPASASAPDPFLGNVCGAGAGLCYAFTLMGLRWLERSGESSLGAVVVGNLGACLIALPWVFPISEAGVIDWTMIAYLGVVQIGLAYVFLTYGLPRCRPSRRRC